jgi:hypothetical protein
MKLALEVTDASVRDYLGGFKEAERPEKALEALRLGVLAIRAAGPALDADVVARAFADAEKRIGTLLEGADKSMRTQIEAKLDGTFGDRGTAKAVLDRYLGDKGVLHAEVLKVVGPGSEFYKRLDPANRDGVVAQIDAVITGRLEASVKAMAAQFSLDTPTSALSRLSKVIAEQFAVIRDEVTKLCGEVQRVTGHEAGKAEEAEKGAGKGMSFEDNLYATLAKQAKGFGDLSESTQGTAGTIPRSKVGDAIVTAGKNFCSAPGERIVWEFKMDRGYKFKDALDEVATARRNRNAQIGVMVFAKGYEPPEIGDFRVVGDSIFCTEDAERASAGEDMIHMEAAYAVARGLLMAMKKTEGGGINAEALKTQIEAVAALAERLSEITTKAATVRNAGDAITELVTKLQTDLKGRVQALQDMLKGEMNEAALTR